MISLLNYLRCVVIIWLLIRKKNASLIRKRNPSFL